MKGQDVANQQARECPLVAGTAVKGIALSTSAKDISHGLGRAFSGYFVTAMYGGTPFGVCLAGKQTDPTRFVSLVASNPGTVDIWVF
jgi:hypothetical protein